MNSINVKLVFATDGSIDVGATREAFDRELASMACEMQYEEETICKAVESVFGANPTAQHNLSAVIYGALRNMGADPCEVAVLEKRVKQWLSSRTDADGKDTGKPYVSSRGRNGGIRRRASNGQTDTMIQPTAF